MLPDFQRNCHKRGFFAASSLLLLLATQTFAQSGRRAPKPTQPPVTTPESDKKQSSIANAREVTRKASLVVAKQLSSKHLLSEDTIFAEFVQKLSEFKNVTTTSVGDLKHDAAVKRAKKETEAFVVLVEFDVDEFQKGTLILNSPDLDVKILVFAPGTGKKQFEGNVYYKAVGGPMLKKDNWPSGTPIRITTEAVGIEAAEQVRDWLIVQERRVKN
jgi:DNA polymerase II small subunit/DNA polymerase delta subunit B